MTPCRGMKEMLHLRRPGSGVDLKEAAGTRHRVLVWERTHGYTGVLLSARAEVIIESSTRHPPAQCAGRQRGRRGRLDRAEAAGIMPSAAGVWPPVDAGGPCRVFTGNFGRKTD
jgi:hypothetical protein